MAPGAARQRFRVARRAEEATEGVRVGLIHVDDVQEQWREAFVALNVTNKTYFQTQVPRVDKESILKDLKISLTHVKTVLKPYVTRCHLMSSRCISSNA